MKTHHPENSKSPLRLWPIAIGLAVVAVPLLMALTSGSGGPSEQAAVATATVQNISIPVEGMSCISCAASIKRAVVALDGVIHAEVDLAARRARVQFDSAHLDAREIAAAINKTGFKAGPPSVEGPR